MTALCGGGSSSPQLGVAAVVGVGSVALGQLLEDTGYGWAKLVVDLLPLPELVLSTFCASDPPAIPTFTSAESNAIVNLTFGSDFTSGVSKLGDLALHLMWPQVCQCNSGPQPVVPVATPPTGTAITYVLPPATNPCGTFAATVGPVTLTTTPTAGPAFDLTGINPSLVVATVTEHDGISVGSFTTTTTLKFCTALTGGTCITAGTTLTQQLNPTTGAGTSQTMQLTPNPSLPFFQSEFHNTGGGSGGMGIHVDLALLCGPQTSPAALSQCCVDPGTTQRLDAILAMVTLIQRQGVPFATVAGASHGPVSGAGAVTLSSKIVGVQLYADSIPDRAGEAGTSPADYSGLGWVTFRDPVAYGPKYRVERSLQTIYPPAAGTWTYVMYDLTPGVSITVQELLREP